jgi:hypothetical protein
VPKDTDITAPSLESDWEQYFALEVDPESGSFTVALNEEGTRLLRSWADGSLATPDESARGDRTTELSLEVADRRGSV